MGAGQFFGALLLIGGVLVALLCGLCTLAVIGLSVTTPVTHGAQNYGGGAMIPVALIAGGLPTGFGVLMIWAGLALIRAGRKSQAPAPKPSAEPTDQPGGR